jgi:hypothetical protein
MAVLAVAVAGATLSGCTHPVADATDALGAELQTYSGVEYLFTSSSEDTLFDDAFSSISIDVAHDITAEQLDDLVTAWRFGVDQITGRWSLGLTRPGGAELGTGYDDFSVVGVRSVADLTAMVRFWHDIGGRTDSAGVSISDYSETQDGFIQLEFPAQPTSSLHELIAPIAVSATELPGRFQWAIDTAVPTGPVSLAGVNLIPDAHMLDVLAAVAAPTDPGDLGPIAYRASETLPSFGPITEPRLFIDVALDPPGFEEFHGDAADLDALGARVLAHPAWALIQTMADGVAHDERAIVVDFSVAGQGVAHLDPWQCSSQQSEQVYGTLTYDLWQHWLRDGGSTPDGSTDDTCLSYG